MNGDQRRAGAARGARGVFELPVERDERLEPDRDDVRCARGIGIVVGELEPRDGEHVVNRTCAGCLGHDRAEIARMTGGVDVTPVRPSVIGDAKDVEAGATLEVDERGERQLSVTPGRVRVELAEQWLGASLHSGHVRRRRPNLCVGVVAAWLRSGRRIVTGSTSRVDKTTTQPLTGGA